jgi:hypothetical protein
MLEIVLSFVDLDTAYPGSPSLTPRAMRAVFAGDDSYFFKRAK